MAAGALLVLAGSCVFTDEQAAGLRRVGSALGQGSSDGSTCGAITHQGCCDGQNLYYCDSGQVFGMDCSQNPSCGWDAAAGYYDCGTSGSPDPSGVHPKTCAAVPDMGLLVLPTPDIGAPVPCGNVTWHGCCDGETLYYCEKGALLSVDCSLVAGACGWKPLLNRYVCVSPPGGADPTGTYPKECVTDAAVPDADTGAALPCDGVTWEGCCDGQTLKYCSWQKLVELDCSDKPSCGWNTTSQVYGCNTDGNADPSGDHPMACPSPPDGGVPCGVVTPWGCCDGQTNYRCVLGSLQIFDCQGNPSCGWGGFGLPFYVCGTPGTADPTDTHPMACDFGDAGPPVVSNNCGGVTWQGCCEGQTMYYCDAGILKWMDCNQSPFCGWNTVGAYSFYDCGTKGKADPSGQQPMSCPFDAGVPDASSDASAGCGPVTHQGCCEGETLYWCAAGTLSSMDCSKSPSCGWMVATGYYDCNTDGTADPFGEHPMACGFDGGAPVLDQGQRLDAAPPHDRSIHDVAGDAAPPTDSGCGCSLVPRSPGGVTLLLLLALVVTLRRRQA